MIGLELSFWEWPFFTGFTVVQFFRYNNSYYDNLTRNIRLIILESNMIPDESCPWNKGSDIINEPDSSWGSRGLQRGTSFVDLLCFFLCVCYAFVRVCLYVPCGHMLGKGWPLGSRLWCQTVSLSHSHWYIVGQVWYLIVSIPDLCTLTYFDTYRICAKASFKRPYWRFQRG